jgi:hypothetical protein
MYYDKKSSLYGLGADNWQQTGAGGNPFAETSSKPTKAKPAKVQAIANAVGATPQELERQGKVLDQLVSAGSKVSNKTGINEFSTAENMSSAQFQEYHEAMTFADRVIGIGIKNGGGDAGGAVGAGIKRLVLRSTDSFISAGERFEAAVQLRDNLRTLSTVKSVVEGANVLAEQAGSAISDIKSAWAQLRDTTSQISTASTEKVSDAAQLLHEMDLKAASGIPLGKEEVQTVHDIKSLLEYLPMTDATRGLAGAYAKYKAHEFYNEQRKTSQEKRRDALEKAEKRRESSLFIAATGFGVDPYSTIPNYKNMSDRQKIQALGQAIKQKRRADAIKAQKAKKEWATKFKPSSPIEPLLVDNKYATASGFTKPHHGGGKVAGGKKPFTAPSSGGPLLTLPSSVFTGDRPSGFGLPSGAPGYIGPSGFPGPTSLPGGMFQRPEPGTPELMGPPGPVVQPLNWPSFAGQAPQNFFPEGTQAHYDFNQTFFGTGPGAGFPAIDTLNMPSSGGEGSFAGLGSLNMMSELSGTADDATALYFDLKSKGVDKLYADTMLSIRSDLSARNWDSAYSKASTLIYSLYQQSPEEFLSKLREKVAAIPVTTYPSSITPKGEYFYDYSGGKTVVSISEGPVQLPSGKVVTMPGKVIYDSRKPEDRFKPVPSKPKSVSSIIPILVGALGIAGLIYLTAGKKGQGKKFFWDFQQILRAQGQTVLMNYLHDEPKIGVSAAYSIIDGDKWVDGGYDSKGCQILKNLKTGQTKVFR